MVHTTALGSDIDPKNIQARELFAVIVDRMMAKGVTLEDFERMLLAPEVEDRVMRAINPNALLNDEMRVYVDYTSPRDERALEAELGRHVHGVKDTFYTAEQWQLHPSCVGMDQTPGERVMLVKCFNRQIAPEDAIIEMDKLGYRPAIYLEAYAFAKVNSELLRLFHICVSGSYVLGEGGRLWSLELHGKYFGCTFGIGLYNTLWRVYDRFLFVRK